MIYNNKIFGLIFLLSFLILIQFPAHSQKKNYKDYTLNKFISEANSNLDKANDIQGLQKFLKKYDFSAIPNKFHKDVSTLNILASEFLVWRNQEVNKTNYLEFLNQLSKNQQFSDQDILRFLILNKTDFFNLDNKKIYLFSNTKKGKVFLCLIKNDECQNENILKLFEDEFLFSNALLSLNVFDKVKAQIIWRRVFKNIIQNTHIKVDDKLRIFSHFNTRLNSISRTFVSQEFMMLSKHLTNNEIKRLLTNKKNFNLYKKLYLESILKDNRQLLKTINFKEKYYFYNSGINQYLKSNLSKFNDTHVLDYLNEIYLMDPQRIFYPQSWYQIIKIAERKAYSIGGEGSVLHLKFLDKLIYTAAEADVQLEKSYLAYAYEIYKNKKIDNISFKTLDNIYESKLKKDKKFDELIAFYKDKIKTKKNNLEKITLKNRPTVLKYLKTSIIIGVCQSSLLLSQQYVQQGDGSTALQTMTDNCSPYLTELIKYSKQMAIPYIYQQYFMAVIQNLVNKKNHFIDFQLINNLAYDERIMFSSRLKMLIILTLSKKIEISEFNKLYVKSVSQITNDKKFSNNETERKFLLKFSEGILMNMSSSQSGIDYKSFLKLKSNLIKLLTTQLLTDAKTNAFTGRHRSYQGLSKENKIIENMISFFKSKNKNKDPSLLTQLIIHEYIFEKDNTNIQNSKLLRLLILSKFSNSESFINYQAIMNKEKTTQYKEYFERRKKLLHLSSNNLSDKKNISTDIIKFIDKSILNENNLKISNEKYLEKIFDFKEPIIKIIQSNLSKNQLYLNFFEMKDINKLLVYGISKNTVEINLIDNLTSINSEINEYKKAINGQIVNYDLNRVFKLKEKILPSAILEKNIDEIRVSADGNIYKLPFSALILKETNAVLNPPIYIASRGISQKNKKPLKSSGLQDIYWLNQKYKITYVPSIIKFKNKEDKKSKILKFLGIGDPDFKGKFMKYADKSFNLNNLNPLPSTREEIKSIATLFDKSNRTTLLGKNASEEKFKNQFLDQFNIIVFATHGFMTSDLSPDSEPGLALTTVMNNDANDGYLSSSEIISLDLKADWVLLTACNTFSTKQLDQNPFAGLASSFLSAGSKGVMSTLWPIETNSAKNFSISAVKKFKNQIITRSEALQKAQQSLRKDRNYQWAHPFYWAPYVNIESTIN